MSPKHSIENSVRQSVIPGDPEPDQGTSIESPADVRRSMELDKKERASAKRQKLSDDYGDQLGQLEEQIKADLSKDERDLVNLRTSQLNRLKDLVQTKSDIEAEIVAHAATLKKAYDDIAGDLSVVLKGRLEDVDEALDHFQDDDGSGQGEEDEVNDGHVDTGGVHETNDLSRGSGLDEPDPRKNKNKRKHHPASVPSGDTTTRAGKEAMPDLDHKRSPRRVSFDIGQDRHHEYSSHDEQHLTTGPTSSEENDQPKLQKELPKKKRATKNTEDQKKRAERKKNDKEEQQANLRAQTASVTQAFHDREIGTTTAPSKQAVDRAMKMARKGMRASKSNLKSRGVHDDGEE